MAKFWERDPSLLLLPNLPTPMHGVNPRSKLGQGWWDRERKEAYASTNFHCKTCGIHKTKAVRGILEGHEVYDTDYAKGTLTYRNTVPLCNLCHQYIHDGRLTMLLNSGLITNERYSAVIRRGDEVLAAVGLRKPSRTQRDIEIMDQIQNGSSADWADWNLIIDTSKYRTRVLNKYKDKCPARSSVYIGRGSAWGNPYVIGEGGLTRDEVIELYEDTILPKLRPIKLFGKDLVCYCAPQRCHGHSILDVLYTTLRFGPNYLTYEDWLAANQQRTGY